MDVFCKVQRQGFAANTSLRIPSSVDQKLRTLRGELFQHLKVYGTVYAVYSTVGWFKFQLFFILTMAKVEATSFGSKNMISSNKKILTRQG